MKFIPTLKICSDMHSLILRMLQYKYSIKILASVNAASKVANITES